MYLVMVFALITFAIGRFPVTRELVITGAPARIFSLLLFLLCGPALALIDYLLALVLPPASRTSIGVAVLSWVLFGVLVLGAAWAVYARTHATVVPGSPGARVSTD